MKLWGGRFENAADAQAHSFNSSLSFDKRLYVYDITGSIAHAKMLGATGIIDVKDSKKIIDGLNQILEDLNNNKLDFDDSQEDIHSFIESELTKRIGDAGKKLHTARSRNDQVCLDMRMYVKEEITKFKNQILNLLQVLTTTAKEHTGTIMPGFTHLQKAQPITLAHHLLAYVQMFTRDFARLQDAYSRADVMPLGSGALAGTVYPINREFVASELGFKSITQNSLDAVSDRDFCLELLSTLSIIMMHLSRICEEIIFWANDAFKFIEIDDKFATGSSIMPQKKNPDMAELVRGKTGRVYGSLMGLLTMLKGLPLAYNKDMQEDKEAVFDACDTTSASLSIFTKMLASIKFKEKNMYTAASGGFTNATDVADYLVNKGLAFRDAHEVVGKLVLFAIEKNLFLQDILLVDLKKLNSIFDNDYYDAIKIEQCVSARSTIGGPAPTVTKKAILDAQKFIDKNRA